MEQRDTQTHLKWQYELDRYTEEIVDLAETAIKAADFKGLREDTMKSQLSNLLGVTLETDSVAVVRNWTLYQMGRDRTTKQVWQETGLGDRVVEDIKTMSGYARGVAERVYGQDPTSSHVGELHIALLRRYAGYLRRWYIAHMATDSRASRGKRGGRS